MRLAFANEKRTRRGFTLVEMVVVLAIILVLVSLLAAAVRMAIIRGAEVKNRHDMMQLEMALQSFNATYGFYPPSRFVLSDAQGPYQTAGIGADSYKYLNGMFTRIGFPVDWNHNNSATDQLVLWGDQCLVWFLAGPDGLNGFSTSPTNPAALGGTRTPVFYEFQVNRLVQLHANDRAIPNNYYSYLDAYKQQPYLYFSAYKSANGYNRYNTRDCMYAYDTSGNSTTINVWPYSQNLTGQFWKPNTFQLISAGRNGVFSQNFKFDQSGNRVLPLVYTPGNAAANLAAGIVDITDTGTVPSDDQGSFASGKLGGGS